MRPERRALAEQLAHFTQLATARRARVLIRSACEDVHVRLAITQEPVVFEHFACALVTLA